MEWGETWMKKEKEKTTRKTRDKNETSAYTKKPTNERHKEIKENARTKTRRNSSRWRRSDEGREDDEKEEEEK